MPDGAETWRDALAAAAMLAVAPESLGGAVLKGFPGPVRDLWLERLRDLFGRERPWNKLPLHINESRLVGGLDLVSTLQLGEPVFMRGLLTASDGGLVQLSMAERADRAIVAQVCAALDRGEVVVERDGFSARNPARIAVLALDEGIDEDERVADALQDRVAFAPDLRAIGIADLDDDPISTRDIEQARRSWRQVELDDEAELQLCAAAAALAVTSLRPATFAVRAARIAAALAGRERAELEDLALAVRLVLVPRSPVTFTEPEPAPEPPPEEESATTEDPAENESDPRADDPTVLDDRIVEAAAALLPPGLLTALARERARRQRQGGVGKSGALRYSGLRGRPVGSVPGDPRQRGRLDLLATLRSAAPWQKLRRDATRSTQQAQRGVVVRADDFRLRRYKQRSESTVIFVVDASGSAALHRLAEAKGAVEMLLADCYVRRDRVALIAFRGRDAELLLPPTRSLVRAKRRLTALPGGGGTPLAAGLRAAAELTDGVRRRGGTPTVVVLTDGRANVCLDGSTGREAAFEDARHCAAMLRLLGARCMVVDTSVRPHLHGEELAQAMGGIYLPLPHADAGLLSRVINERRDAGVA
ncbi:MAG: magnesium chelatase subunit D [Gammaproteobacteria bacterium]|nr:magnesium chelatase subunit D [Gammaproteobacteria bacterium]